MTTVFIISVDKWTEVKPHTRILYSFEKESTATTLMIHKHDVKSKNITKE